MKNVHQNLKEKIDHMPLKPGIYQMKDIEGNIIYVGKSKSLRSRVRSYFYGEHESEKINRMVFHIEDIHYIVTDTHLEAQILECALIKKLQPIYNQQFKNDQRYMYLKIEAYNRFKPLSAVYEKEGHYCLGPFRNKNVLFDTVQFFQNIYPLCKNDHGYEFIYKIFPESIEKEGFEINRNSLIEIFSNKDCMEGFITELQTQMNGFALELRFEMATMYRDMIHHMNYLYHNIHWSKEAENRKLLLGEKIDHGYKLFYISGDRILLKEKLEAPTCQSVEQFLERAQDVEIKNGPIANEKRNLDFKKIIQSEIKDQSQKVLLFLDEEYDLAGFVQLLYNLE